MRNLLLVAFACLPLTETPAATVGITTCEYLVNPLGIDVRVPRFGWQLDGGDARGVRQIAYRLLVASTPESLTRDEGDLWDSGRVASDRSCNVAYDGKALTSRQACWWKVRCWTDDGPPGEWSTPARFELGLLEPAAWRAEWIGMGGPLEATPGASGPLVRKEIVLPGPIRRARAYVSGLGWGELSINGVKVSDDVLTPGLSDYTREIQYCTYDVGPLLRPGPNALGLMLGNGWFSAASILPWERGRWSDRPQAILQLVVELEDGSERVFASDATWKVSDGPIVANQKKPGEEYDARREKPRWNTPGYDDTAWSPATVMPAPGGRLVGRTIPPMKVQRHLRPVAVAADGKGGWRFEFDRFFAGWVRLEVTGPAGTRIGIAFDEGEADSYVLAGNPAGETYEPRFTLHPVRFVTLTGLAAEPSLDTLAGCEVYSDVDLTGEFTCSNPLFERIHANVENSLRVAVKGFILDCVTREPIGYDEPANLSAVLATRKHMPALWTGFLRMIQLAGTPDGDLSDIVPNLPGSRRQSDVSQTAAYPMLVWYLHRCHDDQRLLEEHEPTVRAWVEFIGRELCDESGLVTKGWLGEHMLPGREVGQWEFRSTETPPPFIWTCLYQKNAALLAKISRAVGKPEQADHAGRLADKLRAKIDRTWLDRRTGSYATGSQTAEILPLALAIVPPEGRRRAAERIAARITGPDDGRLRVGHIGLPGFMEALVPNGLGDLVYRTVDTTEFPGWGYMVDRGATTIWEGWGRAGRAESMMMLAGVVRFFYEGLAGIREPDFYGDRDFAPGYGQIRIEPHVLGDLTHAAASIRTIRGVVSSGWRRDGDRLVVDVAIPANATAEVALPDLGRRSPVVSEGGRVIWLADAFVAGGDGIVTGRREADRITFSIGSGRYRFELVGGIR